MLITTRARVVTPAAMRQAAIAGAAVALWFTPPPEGLTVDAWRIFAIFAAAIAAVVVNALPILTASVFGVAALLAAVAGGVCAAIAWFGPEAPRGIERSLAVLLTIVPALFAVFFIGGELLFPH